MAKDDENCGDLYVVGKDGKSHLVKSGAKCEVLFDGKLTNGNECTFSTPATAFSQIVVMVSAMHNEEGVNCYANTNVIPVESIQFKSGFKQLITTFFSTN